MLLVSTAVAAVLDGAASAAVAVSAAAAAGVPDVTTVASTVGDTDVDNASDLEARASTAAGAAPKNDGKSNAW